VEFRVLGPTEIFADNGHRLTLTKPRYSAALCVFLLNQGVHLTHAYLAEAIWGADLPANPRGALRAIIYNLRKISGISERLCTHTSGYVIQLREADVLDVSVFLGLGQEALEASRRADYASAVRLLEGTLAVWRTPPLADLPATAVMQPLAAELLERRLAAEEALVDARMALGDYAQLLPMLKALTAAEPLRERRWEQLMLALYCSGRQVEALHAYSRARDVLSSEFGLEPGEGLRRLQERVLAGDPALGTELGSTAATASRLIQAGESLAPITTPHQLPNPVPGLVGRRGELSALSTLASRIDGRGHSAVLAVISGSAGVGKSALAVFAAHQIAKYFPDGQLYVDMKGFSVGQRPVDPAKALRAILETLGIPRNRIPASVDARAALYRSLLSGRQMLLVVDDLRDSAQGQHLVPASPACMMIVTSRRKITGLVTGDGATTFNLDVLTREQAATLLASLLPPGRSAGDAQVIADLAEQCAFLPLALVVAASRVAARPHLSLADLAQEMREVSGRLDALTSQEPGSDIRAAFSQSYLSLTPPAALLFRRMSLHPDPEITVRGAAALAGIPVKRARAALVELDQMHLIGECSPDRFRLHDLLRAYAAERLAAEPGRAELLGSPGGPAHQGLGQGR
jgi:DNA-binding SARP family transcriptional activator